MIEFKSVDKLLEFFKRTTNKIQNIEDSLPFIKSEIINISPNINIELEPGMKAAINKVPYSSKQTKELRKVIETDHIIPIKTPQQVKQPKIKQISQNIIKPKKVNINKIKKDISNFTIKWLLKDE